MMNGDSLEKLHKIYRSFIFPYSVLIIYFMTLGFGRTQYDTNIIRLTPFHGLFLFIKKSIYWGDYINLIINFFGNIILFVPFGFLGWIFTKYLDLKTLLYHFLSAIIIMETIQYFTRLGVFDIDDILLNSLGVCFGFWLRKKWVPL